MGWEGVVGNEAARLARSRNTAPNTSTKPCKKHEKMPRPSLIPKVEEANNSSNPQNRTVVDRRVTEARNCDFFMQAHKAIQGTARPCTVRHNDDKFLGKCKQSVSQGSEL
jgi:hypothetical protein